MEAIQYFSEVINYLKTAEIVYYIDNKEKVFFYLKDELVVCNSINKHYSLTIDDFQSLFQKATFYLYTVNEESIDLTKDDEYYKWKNAKDH